MSKIHLIIVDREEAYVDAISSYLLNNHSQKFKISFFTEQKFLLDYLKDLTGQVDALLINSRLYSELIPQEKINALILLSDEIIKEKNRTNTISKYQSGKKLVKDILSILAENDSKLKYNFSEKRNSTKVIGVYSPCGGVGKTSIAVGCSYLSSERGKKTFYLNLEDYQSTQLFFNSETEGSLSEVLYYIKNKKKNILLKIESITNEDYKTKINYFTQPESVIDLNEITSKELVFLVNHIKSIRKYDVVYIDMSSKLDEKNIAILSEIDEILLVLERNVTCEKKIETMINNLKIISKRKNTNILEKMIFVINKYDSNDNYNSNNTQITKYANGFKVPFIEEIDENEKTLNNNTKFTSSLWDLIDRILF